MTMSREGLNCVFVDEMHGTLTFEEDEKGANLPRFCMEPLSLHAGVGKETALELARRGARVVIGCRNLQKARLVAQEIFDRTQQRVIVKHLDMNSLKSVRHFCDDVIKTEDRLDVLINNAGAIGRTRENLLRMY